MNSVEIVELNPDQWPEFKDLRLSALRSNPEAFGLNLLDAEKRTESDWRQRLEKADDQTQFIRFAKINNKLVGMMSGYVLDNPTRGDLGDTVKLGEVFVKDSFRGQGVGNELLEALIKAFKKNPQLKKLLIKVFVGQTAAIKLYESVGAKVREEITEDWPDGRKEQTYIMEKDLKADQLSD